VRFSAALPWAAGSEAALDARLQVIADPASPSYGAWMTQAEVNAMTAPPPALRAQAAAALKAAGAVCVDMPHSLKCTATVGAANALFGTKISAFAHTAAGGARVLRVHPNDAYAFPDALRGSVEFVTSLLDFPTQKRVLGKSVGSKATLRACAGWRPPSPPFPPPPLPGAGVEDYSIVPESLTAIYGHVKPGNMKATYAPVEFQGDPGFAAKDLTAFAEAAGLPAWNISHKIGPSSPSGGDLEATLDVQYMGAVAQGADAWYWTEADWQYEWVEHLAATPDAGVPQVFSMSWGWSEGDQCRIDPTYPACKAGDKGAAAYVAACNAGYMAAGARGISIVISSGDSGAHGRTDGACTSPVTRPDFPTASPYILAVGATQLVDGTPLAAPKSPICVKNPNGVKPCAGGGTEVTCSTATGALISSGGGFSNVAARPQWQAAAVAKYLQTPAAQPPAGDFNATSRGYPDVSALGHNCACGAPPSPPPPKQKSCAPPPPR
jgi:tripeptidyl-peptidase-1